MNMVPRCLQQSGFSTQWKNLSLMIQENRMIPEYVNDPIFKSSRARVLSSDRYPRYGEGCGTRNIQDPLCNVLEGQSKQRNTLKQNKPKVNSETR